MRRILTMGSVIYLALTLVSLGVSLGAKPTSDPIILHTDDVMFIGGMITITGHFDGPVQVVYGGMLLSSCVLTPGIPPAPDTISGCIDPGYAAGTYQLEVLPFGAPLGIGGEQTLAFIDVTVGVQGPAGPTGPTGAVGAEGADGATGPAWKRVFEAYVSAGLPENPSRLMAPAFECFDSGGDH